MEKNIVFAPLTVSVPGRAKEISKIIDLSEIAGNLPGVKIFTVLQSSVPLLPVDDLIGILALELKNSFAASPDMFLSQEKFYAGFETALKNTNSALYKFIVQKNLLLNEQNFNIALGGIFNHYLVMATRGNIRSVLFHKDQNGNFVLINIAGTAVSRMNAAKLFNQTVGGAVGEHDIVFIAPPEIFESLGSNSIKKNITENNIATAYEAIKNELIEKNISQNSSILMIKFSEAKVHGFADKLNLAATGLAAPKIKNIASFLGTFLLKCLKAIPPNLWKFARWLMSLVWRGLKLVPPLLNRLIHPRETAQTVKEGAKVKIETGIGKFNALPRQSRVVLIIILAVATIAVQGIYFLNERYKIRAANSVYLQKIAIIKAEKESAESSLEYGDKKTALELFIDARDSLAALSKKSADQNDLKTLLADIDLQLSKLGKITQIDNPPILAELPRERDAKFIGLAFLNGDLYAWADNDRAIYVTDESGKISKQTFSDNFGYLKSGYVVGNQIFFSHSGSGLLKINAFDKTITSAELNGWNKPVSSFAFFTDKLYVTDPASGQIIKFSPMPAGFTNPVSWLKEPVKIDDSTEIAIDSKVYLYANSRLTEFLKGEETSFSLEEVSPQIGKDSKIKISSNYIYILDPRGKRLIVWDKKGALVGQFTSASFDSLSDFTISPDGKKAYFLNDNKIYGSILNLNG